VLEWAYGRRDWRKDGERRRHVMALPMLTLRHSATLVSPSAGDRLVNFSVGTDDELEALWCADQDWDALFGRGLDWPRKVRSGRTGGTSNGWGDPGPVPPGWRGVIRYEPDALQPIWHYPQGSA